MDDTDGFAEPRDRRSSTTKVGYLQQVDLDEDEDGMAPRRMGVKEHSSKDGGEATIAGTTFNLVNNIVRCSVPHGRLSTTIALHSIHGACCVCASFRWDRGC